MPRFALFVVALVLLLSPLAARASHAPASPPAPAAPQATDCALQEAMLATQGKPTAQATLLASATGTPPQAGQTMTDVYVVRPGDTLGKIASRFGTSVRAIMDRNGLANPNFVWSGQRLYIPGVAANAIPLLPTPFKAVWLDGDAVQGEAALVWVQVRSGTTVRGHLGAQQIPFQSACGLLWGLVAFDALLDDPGTYNLVLAASGPDGNATRIAVPMTLREGDYPTGNIIVYPDDRQRLLDPTLIRSENQRLNDLFAALPASAPKWSGPFWMPLDSYVTNIFGYRGSINGGPPTGYHEGIDLRGRVGTPVIAPAAGTVVLAELLTVRGNVVFLDHGAGVVSGYFHLSEMEVEVGDTVAQGELLGRVGATGLVTGPHLHWEMRVNGRWVNPAPWTRRSVP